MGWERPRRAAEGRRSWPGLRRRRSVVSRSREGSRHHCRLSGQHRQGRRAQQRSTEEARTDEPRSASKRGAVSSSSALARAIAAAASMPSAKTALDKRDELGAGRGGRPRPSRWRCRRARCRGSRSSPPTSGRALGCADAGRRCCRSRSGRRTDSRAARREPARRRGSWRRRRRPSSRPASGLRVGELFLAAFDVDAVGADAAGDPRISGNHCRHAGCPEPAEPRARRAPGMVGSGRHMRQDHGGDVAAGKRLGETRLERRLRQAGGVIRTRRQRSGGGEAVMFGRLRCVAATAGSCRRQAGIEQAGRLEQVRRRALSSRISSGNVRPSMKPG